MNKCVDDIKAVAVFVAILAAIVGGALASMILGTKFYKESRIDMIESHRNELVGGCIDVGPGLEGKVLDVMNASEIEVKVALTGDNGNKNVIFIPLAIAKQLVTPCLTQ